MSDDARRREAIDKFYKAYRELQQYDNLRMHSRSVLDGETLIEIWRQSGTSQGERILKVSLDDEVDAYIHATELIGYMLTALKKTKEERKCSA